MRNRYGSKPFLGIRIDPGCSIISAYRIEQYRSYCLVTRQEPSNDFSRLSRILFGVKRHKSVVCVQFLSNAKNIYLICILYRQDVFPFAPIISIHGQALSHAQECSGHSNSCRHENFNTLVPSVGTPVLAMGSHCGILLHLMWEKTLSSSFRSPKLCQTVCAITTQIYSVITQYVLSTLQ